MKNIHVSSTVRFEDIEELNQYSTDSTWSDWGAQRVVTDDDVRDFAKLTNNHQWIHEDAKRSTRESPYGGMIVHGLLLITLIPGLMPGEGFVVSGNTVRIVRGFDRLRLPSPVFVGDTVHARVRNLRASAAASGKGTVIAREVEVWSLAGTKPAVSCMLKMQYF